MFFFLYLKILDVYVSFPAIFAICLSDKAWYTVNQEVGMAYGTVYELLCYVVHITCVF